MSAGATGATAAYVAIMEAKKAIGPIIHIENEDFLKLVNRGEEPLVVFNHGGVFRKVYSYLFSMKGFVFVTRSQKKLPLPGKAQVIKAQKLDLPNL